MKNNKGFSLVELIIVIAIMAVLVGVLAPTYLQYVEKSKKSNDVSTVDSIVNACEIGAIDPEVMADTTETITVVIDNNGTYITPATGSSAWSKSVIDAIGTDAKLKSTNWGGPVAIKATRIRATGKVSFEYVKANVTIGGTTYNCTAGSTAFDTYAVGLSKIS